MKKQDRLPLTSAVVSPSFARKLVVKTAESLIGDEDFKGSTSVPYAAEYIGWLMDYLVEQDENWTKRAAIPDVECNPRVSIGPVLFTGKAVMRQMFGTLHLDGSDPAFDPTIFDVEMDELDVAIAACSDEAVAVVWNHMAVVYGGMIEDGSAIS